MDVNDSDVTALREWIALHPYLPQDSDDYLLRCFIIGSKGSLQQAKIRFEKCYRAIQDYPTLFQQDDILYSDASIKFNETTAICYMPVKTKENYRILISKILVDDPKDYFTASLYLQRVLLTMFISIWDHEFDTGEIVVIPDMKGIHTRQLATFGSTEISGNVALIDHATCERIKAIHIIEINPIVEKLLNLIKRATSEKMRQRIHFHSSYKDLHKFFSKDQLPKEYGGDLPPMREIHENYLERVKFHHDKIVIENKKRQQEVKLRPKSEDSTMADTFRKLDID